MSTTTVELNASKLKDGDVAGLGNINVPCSWIGIVKEGKQTILRCFDQHQNDTVDTPVALKGGKVWLRFDGDFDNDKGRYSYSLDGTSFTEAGKEITLGYQLITFQGSRLSLFAFNKNGKNGGYAEFDNFIVDEPLADRSKNIPLGKTVKLYNLANNRLMTATRHGHLHDTHNSDKSPATHFTVIDKGEGKVALRTNDGKYVCISGAGLTSDVRTTTDESKAELFMWQDMLHNECMLLSMSKHLYIGKDPLNGNPYDCEYKGADPARRNGAVFRWTEVIK